MQTTEKINDGAIKMLTRRTAMLSAVASLTTSMVSTRTSWSKDAATVGVLIPGAITDHSFMESAYNGLTAAKSEFGDRIRVQSIENSGYAEVEQALVMLAQKNEFVTAVSGASQAAMIKVAKRFPSVKFSLVGGSRIDGVDNLQQCNMRQAEVSFLSGAAAAMFSKTGVVSFVAGVEIPGVVNSSKEFKNGARYVRPDINPIVVFTGDFDDVSKAKEATAATISQGADIHAFVLNRGTSGLEEAARKNRTRLVGGITPRCGVDDLYCAYSETGVGYILREAIRSYLDSTWTAGSKIFGLKAGPSASNLMLCDTSNPEIGLKIDQIKQKIISGEIQTLDG